MAANYKPHKPPIPTIQNAGASSSFSLSQMNWPLFDSPLIIFRCPPSNQPLILCTATTLHELLRVTKLAQLTDDIEIACLPNIWSSNYTIAANYASTTTSPYSTESMIFEPSSASDYTSASSIEFEKPCDNPRESHSSKYDLSPPSRFFVIKSFSEEDVHASITHGVWTSTRLGNERLNAAYLESPNSNIYLLFLVNGSSKFCGVARMVGAVDFTKESDIWLGGTRWKGLFPVEWLQVQDIPNKVFRYLRVSTNSNKCVTNSRDTQELPYQIGVSMLDIYANFRHLE